MTGSPETIRTVFIYSFILFLFIGCVTSGEREHQSTLFSSQVTLFLHGPDKGSQDITFDLSAVTLVREDGAAREIINIPVSINSRMIEGSQILLGERTIPEGTYDKLKLLINNAFIRKEDRTAQLALPAEEIVLDININIRKRQNTTLFITWNADASVDDGYLFNPLFSVKQEMPELSSLLVYVTNEGSDNVSVINRQSGEIAATIMVGSKPRGIAAASAGGEHLKVYVVNSGSDSISVIDPTTQKIENEIPIRFGKQPEAIAVASLSSEREFIFVTSAISNTVSVVDASTYQETEKINVGRGPIAIATDPWFENLTGTRFLSFEEVNILRSYREKFLNVYVVNQNSNSVSLLRIDRETGRSAEVIDLNVGWRPVALYVDYKRGKVFVANYGSDNLSVIDIVETVKGNINGAVSTINNVGLSITGVVSDPAFDRIYLLKESPGALTIVKPFSEDIDSLKTVMTPVMGTISVGSYPRALTFDPEGRKLYVVNSGSDTISVIDKTTRKVEQNIQVGNKPYGIALFSTQ